MITRLLKCKLVDGMFSDEKIATFKNCSYIVRADAVNESKSAINVDFIIAADGPWVRLPTTEYPTVIPIEETDLLDVEVLC